MAIDYASGRNGAGFAMIPDRMMWGPGDESVGAMSPSGGMNRSAPESGWRDESVGAMSPGGGMNGRCDESGWR